MPTSRTSTIPHRWLGPVVATATLVCLSIPGGAQQPDRVRGVAGPGQAPAYLALGDSYPYGSDGTGFLPNNDNFWFGYPEVLRGFLDRPLVNPSCPGETTASFLTGDPLLAGPNCQPAKEAGLLHVDYTGSQMDFAESYLATHSEVVLVTLQLGGNDFQAFVGSCPSVQCILDGLPGFMADLAANFDEILGRIRGTGYEGPIIVVEYPSTNFNGMGAQLQQLVYQAIKPAVEAHGGQMAPVFARFQVAAEPFDGDSCAAGLLMLDAGGKCNIHPTDAGHQMIADIIGEMLGFDLP